MKEFPRLYSLSTLGLIHHQEFDYRFHPLRTDFMGDSGTGKSMISDLLQLIFVGSGAFESATKGTDERKPTGMVLQQTGRGADIGYAFLNIEIQKNQFLCLGVYIESTSSHTESFIVQNGYDFSQLTSFGEPLTTADFLKNEEILPLDTLKEHLEEQALICESWQRVKSYHEILFNNELLPLNLAENDKTLKDFAQIIQSFSRGKTLETNKSNSLKDFLFGNDEAKKILKQFKDAVKEFESDMGEYGRNRQEIDRVTQKQNDYVELKQKKDKRDELQHNWLKQDFLCKHQNRNKLLLELKEGASDHRKVSQFLEKVKVWATSEKDDIETISPSIGAKSAESRKVYDEIIPEYSILLKAQKLLADLNCTPKALKEHYEQNRALRDQNRIITTVKTELTAMDLLSYFKSYEWPNTYSKFTTTTRNRTEHHEAELAVKDTLKGYANLMDEESLGYWALHQNRPLNWEEESTLIHFQQLPRTKPDNKKRFLPSPEEFIQALTIAEKETEGFWLNLSGIREFIKYTPKRIFDTTNKAKIQTYFDAFSQELDTEIKDLQLEIKRLNQLQAIFDKSDHPKKFYETYLQPDLELPKQEIEALTLSLEEFQKYQGCLSNEKRISDQFKKACEDHQQAIKYEKSIGDKHESFTSILRILDYEKDTSTALDKILEEYGNEMDESISQSFNELSTESLTETIVSHKQKLNAQNLIELSDQYKSASTKLEDAEKSYLKFYHNLPDLDVDMESLLQEPTEEREQYLRAETAYQEHYNHIIKTYLAADSHRFGDTFDFLELGENLLPEALRDQAITEQNVIDKIQYYLNQINDKNRQLTSRKIQKIKSIVDEVDTVVGEQLDTARRIDNFFTENEKQITGGYQVRLSRELSQNYPKTWINTFKDAVENQMSLFSDNSQTELTDKLALEVSLEDVMTKAFYACGGSKNVKVDIPRLLDPASYYDLTFSMKSATGRTNIGSTGQTYAAISLLCIARLSVIGRKESERQKTGIRFMPIDEAEGLGSNYDLLYNIAKDYDYQIISMSVGSVGRFKEGAQYVYILHKNIDEDDPVNFPPMAIWSQADLYDE